MATGGFAMDGLMLLLDTDSDSDDSDDLLLLGGLLAPETGVTGPFKFTLEDIGEEECVHLFRFAKTDIPILGVLLALPEKVTCANGSVASRELAMCVVLRRLAYPNRLKDLVPVFGRTHTELSSIFNETINLIHATWTHLLDLLDKTWLMNSLEDNAAAVRARAPLDMCIGSIDGTTRAIARPTHNQRTVYSGHKRAHVLKYQSVVAPCGIIVSLHGPVEGRRHDAAILTESDVLEQLSAMSGLANREYYIYGDAAYPVRRNLICPFKGANLTDEEQQFNTQMSRVRQSVEWGFGKVVSLFAFLDFRKNMKLELSPVGKYYRVGVILTNVHSCLYGSQTSDYFQLQPPTIQEYLAN